MNSPSISRFFLSCFSLRLVLVDDGLRRQRVLVILGVEEHAGERVVVLRRDRIVLVIVAAGAADGQAEEAAVTASTRSCRSSARVISTAPLS